MSSPYAHIVKPLDGGGKFFDLSALDAAKYGRLPFSIRVLLESAVRNCDNFQVREADVAKILDWEANTAGSAGGVEVPFRPARVILQDYTGVPAVVDFAAMRDAVQKLGGNPELINPQCPSDLVIDHSVQVDFVRSAQAQSKNESLEFERNRERFTFLKWGAKAFKNMLIVSFSKIQTVFGFSKLMRCVLICSGAARFRHCSPGELGIPCESVLH